MANHAGTVVAEDGGNDQAQVSVAKDGWAEKGVGGGLFRLALAPISSKEAVVYLQIAPGDPETFRARLDVIKIPEQYSGVPAVNMTGTQKIPLGPREPEAMKAGLALLPFLNINAPNDTGVILPTTEHLRREMAGTLRAVCKPRKCPSVKEFKKLLASNNPPQADSPGLLWPLPRVERNPVNAMGELLSCNISCNDCEWVIMSDEWNVMADIIVAVTVCHGARENFCEKCAVVRNIIVISQIYCGQAG